MPLLYSSHLVSPSPTPPSLPLLSNSWLMLKWENAFRAKINKEQTSKKVSTANQQMMLGRLLERPWLQNLALSSWVISFVEPQFTYLVRMDRMICTHRLNEIMYVKEFNESGDLRRGTWTGHGCDKVGISGLHFSPPLSWWFWKEPPKKKIPISFGLWCCLPKQHQSQNFKGRWFTHLCIPLFGLVGTWHTTIDTQKVSKEWIL